jgi:hypothetical protein
MVKRKPSLDIVLVRAHPVAPILTTPPSSEDLAEGTVAAAACRLRPSSDNWRGVITVYAVTTALKNRRGAGEERLRP